MRNFLSVDGFDGRHHLSIISAHLQKTTKIASVSTFIS